MIEQDIVEVKEGLLEVEEGLLEVEDGLLDVEEIEDTRHAYPRLWEVDTLRGLAIVAMVAYHVVFDLAFFDVYTGDIHSPGWKLIARSIASTFMLVMGISLTLKYRRLEARLDARQIARTYLRRGATLFAWGLVINVVTYFTLDDRFVLFGILHLLGLSTILAFPFLRSRRASLIGGVAAIATGVGLGDVRVLFPWLHWLGVRQLGRSSVDFFPVFPWFGVVLLGIWVGLTFYPRGSRLWAMPDLSHTLPVRLLTYLGQHSLTIYLIHQPVLLGLMIVLGIGSL
ncbi:MAG TPA: heparan-alpha-glucosaminide N-acetyltransferase [Anaerolineae bacterium]|nr:heparan-alpha-glucosaminide N-acetyltransferase [Anaerolineae bacterium]